MADNPLPLNIIWNICITAQSYKSNTFFIRRNICIFAFRVYADLWHWLDHLSLSLTIKHLKWLNLDSWADPFDWFLTKAFLLCWQLWTDWKLQSVHILVGEYAALWNSLRHRYDLNGIELVLLSEIKCQSWESATSGLFVIYQALVFVLGIPRHGFLIEISLEGLEDWSGRAFVLDSDWSSWWRDQVFAGKNIQTSYDYSLWRLQLVDQSYVQLFALDRLVARVIASC